ncbi:MAG TPA: hypothetical protein VMC84_12315 [Methanocella sp.]|nr:hypothetical protein [Methanocella sp.]HTY91951.1 hypothetical protein [Methanocella sp.]
MKPLRGGNLARPAKEIRAIWNEAEIKRSPADWGCTGSSIIRE